MEQATLFDNDPALRMRDSKGRFATPERARADKAIEENKYLRLQVEKFRRSYLAAGKLSAVYYRELMKVKNELSALLRKIENKNEQCLSEAQGETPCQKA